MRAQCTVLHCRWCVAECGSEPRADAICGGMKSTQLCSPLSLGVGFIKWSNVLCLVGCDDTQIHITTRPLGEREGGREGGTVEGRAKTHVMQSTHQVIEDTSCNGIPHKLFSLTQLPTEKADRKQDEEERRRHGQVTLLTSMSGRYLSSKVAIAASDPEPMET